MDIIDTFSEEEKALRVIFGTQWSIYWRENVLYLLGEYDMIKEILYRLENYPTDILGVILLFTTKKYCANKVIEETYWYGCTQDFSGFLKYNWNINAEIFYINDGDYRTNSLIHFCECRLLKMMKLVLDEGIDPNFIDKNGYNALTVLIFGMSANDRDAYMVRHGIKLLSKYNLKRIITIDTRGDDDDLLNPLYYMNNYKLWRGHGKTLLDIGKRKKRLKKNKRKKIKKNIIGW